VTGALLPVFSRLLSRQWRDANRPYTSRAFSKRIIS
jgi:hypothetical protein